MRLLLPFDNPGWHSGSLSLVSFTLGYVVQRLRRREPKSRCLTYQKCFTALAQTANPKIKLRRNARLCFKKGQTPFKQSRASAAVDHTVRELSPTLPLMCVVLLVPVIPFFFLAAKWSTGCADLPRTRPAHRDVCLGRQLADDRRPAAVSIQRDQRYHNDPKMSHRARRQR